MSGLIKESLSAFRVVRVVLFELFGPLCKWGVIPLDRGQPDGFHLGETALVGLVDCL